MIIMQKGKCRIMRKNILYSLLVIMVVSFCSCGNNENIEDKNNDNIVYDNKDYVIPLGVYAFGEKDSTSYAYYEFTEKGNTESTCYWDAKLLENGKEIVSEATLKYELEKIGETFYIMMLGSKAP